MIAVEHTKIICNGNTMVYEIRASADMIRANCLFSAVGWKEWGRKKDRKRLFPTTPPASSLKRGFARIISAFARLSSTMVHEKVDNPYASSRRPKGSTNNKTKEVTFGESTETEPEEKDQEKVKKGPGRPKGSKKKDKTEMVKSQVFTRKSGRNRK